MPQAAKDEPVITATLVVPAIVWLALQFGVDMDTVTATSIAGIVLAIGAWIARSRVSPVQKGGDA